MVPVPPVMATVTSPVNPVAVLPWLSRAVTTTVKPAPAVVVAGWVVTTSWLAVPAVMAKVLLTALLGPVAEAVRV
ncbi:hypothetical protein D3C83_171390 [compost metagenome]